MSPYSDTQYTLAIELDTDECSLAEYEQDRMINALSPLDRVVRRFPAPKLHIRVIQHPRSNDYHVKTSLVLPGRTLFTGDRDDEVYSAYTRCIRKLVRKVQAYEDELSEADTKAKQATGKEHEVFPDWQPDLVAVKTAVEVGDYPTFRTAMYGYDEPLRKRAGRWVQQYPEVESRVGEDLKLEDLVEEVMLNAFEHYEDKPEELRVGEWLETLIDPSLWMLLRRQEDELDNVSFVRTWQEARAQWERDSR
jgi:ribosome-associated translation inhibitor RaiA